MDAFLAAEWRLNAERIDQYGFTVAAIGYGLCSVPGCDEPASRYPYSFTLGMHLIDHPELVMLGAPLGCGPGYAQFVYDSAVAGEPLAIGREHRHWITDKLAIALDPIPARWVDCDPGKIGMWFFQFGHEVEPRFVQMVFSAGDGSMPWEHSPTCGFAREQPLIADHPLRYPYRAPGTRHGRMARQRHSHRR